MGGLGGVWDDDVRRAHKFWFRRRVSGSLVALSFFGMDRLMIVDLIVSCLRGHV
jgi:hypothetical protein